MKLDEHLHEIRSGIKGGRYSNEASVSQGIVLRILHALSWPTYDTQVVCPEYLLETRRVDFGLCHPRRKPIAFIEVKQIGQSEQAERQLFEYAFHVGIPLAILTDGQQWNFFLPAEQGSYGERRVYKLDIVERDVPECVARLSRYLQYEAICSGGAIEAARSDYKNVSREREMRATLPRAWIDLVEEEDELLLELIADRVESLCGFKPDPDAVASFLRTNVALKVAPDITLTSKARSAPQADDGLRSPRAITPNGIGFVLHAQSYPARSARDVLISIIRTLAECDSSFLDRFAALPKHGRTRRYLAKSPDELYPGRPDLARDHSVEIKPGWWLGINLSHAAVKRIVEMACDVAGLKFDRDLKVSLGD